MKSKIAIIACLVVIAMWILPANVSAFTINSSASTNETSYTLGDLVQISVEWEVTVPTDFVHDFCAVVLNPHPVSVYHSPMYGGNYTVHNSTAIGVVDVYCNDDDGTAYYEWDSNAGWVGTWVVSVVIEAHDYSQTPPDDMPYDELDTNTFTLN